MNLWPHRHAITTRPIDPIPHPRHGRHANRPRWQSHRLGEHGSAIEPVRNTRRDGEQQSSSLLDLIAIESRPNAQLTGESSLDASLYIVLSISLFLCVLSLLTFNCFYLLLSTLFLHAYLVFVFFCYCSIFRFVIYIDVHYYKHIGAIF